jgi:hypothetical protein
MNFLFWNTAKNSVTDTLSGLVAEHSINVLILAECSLASHSLATTLSRVMGRDYFVPKSNCSKITILTDFSAHFCSAISEGNRFSIQSIQLPGKDEVLLAAVHLPSKMDMSEQSQQFECFKLSRDILSAEKKRNHQRTILVGDFNMNPFEAGLVAAGGIHGVMARETAAKKERTVQGEQYPFFYNPTWSLFGDIPSGPPGTIYYEKAEDVCLFWGLFDQVLIRPDLLESFDTSSLRVVTEAKGQKLVCEKGRPTKALSDHLPLVFSVKI